MGKEIPTRRGARAFTLIDAIISMAILSILLSAGVPGLTHMVRQNRMAISVNEFVASLSYARSEAVKRGLRVVVCQSHDGEACAAEGGWHPGWIVFVDRNGNREYDADEALLRVSRGVHEDIQITSAQRRRIVFQPSGTSGGSNGTYVFCMPKAPPLKRAVILSNTGRVRLSDTRPDGQELQCA